MKTGKEWNSICEAIAYRASGNPVMSIKAVEVHPWRTHKHVQFVMDDWGKCIGARYRIRLDAALRRREQMRDSKEAREAKTCQCCGLESDEFVAERWDVYGWDADRRYRGFWISDTKQFGKIRLCWSCARQAREILKARAQADEINDLVKSLNKERLKWQRSQRQAS
jgi:hypothetical protein